MKKTISIVLIPFLLLQLYSCYSMRGIGRGELIKKTEKGDIRITTYQLEVFEFRSYYYQVESDTLSGTGEKIIDKHTTIPFSGKIALKDIEFVEENKFDIGTTCLTLVGASLVIALIVFMMALHEFGENLKGCNARG